MVNKCVIVIPIYKSVLSRYELISLERITQVCKHNPITFIAPKGLKLAKYEMLHNVSFATIYFDPKFFKSIKGYNSLLISPLFYKCFLKYQYLLLYQLDAFVFDFNIDQWCNKEYDYIGAPWFDKKTPTHFYHQLLSSSNLIVRFLKRIIDFNKGNKLNVGNGGLSLRKVKTFYKISKWLPLIEPNLKKYNNNEDMVWSILVTKYFYNFKVPDFKEALKFSIEKNPKEGLAILENKLPFGCHAWEKYNISVWRPIFKKYDFII